MMSSKSIFYILVILGLSSCSWLKPEQKILDKAQLGKNPATITSKVLDVAECDDYISRYKKCIAEKIPERSKPFYTDAIDDVVKYWKTQTDSPEGKMGLVTACQVAYLGSRETMKAFGCEI